MENENIARTFAAPRRTTGTNRSSPDDPNSYSYCFNNPVNNIDPTGHWSLPTTTMGWVKAIVSAAAILNPELALVSMAVNFLPEDNKVKKTEDAKKADEAAKENKPIKDKVQQEKEQSNNQNQNNQTEKQGSGLFKDTDLELNPEVQQAISYYDDMDLYADVAYEKGIINEQEYTALKRRCGEEVTKLRQTNKVEQQGYSIGDLVFDTILAVVPGGDILGNSSTAYAATYDAEAITKISGSIGFITKSISSNVKYTVYELYDPNTMEVKYVGRTRQNIEVRRAQHWNADPFNKKGLAIQATKFKGVELSELSYVEARGLEQLIYDRYTNKGIKLLNKIRPLNVDAKGLRATVVKGYQEAAEAFLKVFRVIP